MVDRVNLGEVWGVERGPGTSKLEENYFFELDLGYSIL